MFGDWNGLAGWSCGLAGYTCGFGYCVVGEATVTVVSMHQQQLIQTSLGLYLLPVCSGGEVRYVLECWPETDELVRVTDCEVKPDIDQNRSRNRLEGDPTKHRCAPANVLREVLHQAQSQNALEKEQDHRCTPTKNFKNTPNKTCC